MHNLGLMEQRQYRAGNESAFAEGTVAEPATDQNAVGRKTRRSRRYFQLQLSFNLFIGAAGREHRQAHVERQGVLGERVDARTGLAIFPYKVLYEEIVEIGSAEIKGRQGIAFR